MRNFVISAMLATCLVAPAQAADFRDYPTDTRPGAFVGARLKLSLGGKTAARPQAMLTIAPTQSRTSNGGMVRTTIGEGLALNFGPRSKPTLSLAGVRVDRALRLAGPEQTDSEGKKGLSTGAWIAIGLVAVVGAGALWYTDYCNDNEATLCGDEE